MKLNKILDSLYFHYQPIVNTQSGNTIGVEAFLRGYETFNYSGVHDFFDHLIKEKEHYEIEKLLILKIIKDFKKLDFFRKIVLFINISNVIIDTKSFNFEDFKNIFISEGIPLDNIAFDLDGSKKKSLKKILNFFLQKVSTENFKISIDNFGIDSITLPLLYETSPHFLKIDKVFIESLKKNIKYRTFIEYIIKYSHLFGVAVIAECVERKEEFLMVKQLGIDMAQGYLVSPEVSNINEIKISYDHINKMLKIDRREQIIDEDLIRKGLRTIKPIEIDAPIETVFDQFKDNPGESLFPVVDKTNHPLGVICEETLKKYIYAPYGKELLTNRSINTTLRKFITTKIPIVDIKSSIEDIIETYSIYSQHKNTLGIIITKEQKYLGFLYPSDIIKIINRKEIDTAKELNPLTKLPGNIVINNYISKSLKDTSRYKYFIYFDFDNFKPFNDTFGFRLGDRAILLFKETLFRSVSANEFFIGHIGGDDFFIAAESTKEIFNDIYNIVKTIIENFTNNILSFFDDESRSNGYYVGINRKGEKEVFPLLSISAALIEIPQNTSNTNEDMISKMLANLKKIAKTSSEKIACSSINKS
jgi:diguanylate cyclase (GGDEF)-like protein